jgi:hypothetical protein
MPPKLRAFLAGREPGLHLVEVLRHHRLRERRHACVFPSSLGQGHERFSAGMIGQLGQEDRLQQLEHGRPHVRAVRKLGASTCFFLQTSFPDHPGPGCSVARPPDRLASASRIPAAAPHAEGRSRQESAWTSHSDTLASRSLSFRTEARLPRQARGPGWALPIRTPAIRRGMAPSGRELVRKLPSSRFGEQLCSPLEYQNCLYASAE